MIYLLLICFGLVLGSFINALIWRLHEQSKYYDDEGRLKKLNARDKRRLSELSITKGRSMCAHCGHQLSALDLVPVFSWLALRGRCRYCHKKIDDKPWIEAAMPVLLVVTYFFWPYELTGALDYALLSIWVLMMTCFMALAVYDARWYLLPNKIVFPLIGLAGCFALLVSIQAGSAGSLLAAGLAAGVLSGVFLGLYVVSRGAWIGFGDVKLAMALGLIVGTPLMSFLVIFIASVSGTITSLPQLLRRADMRRSIPFGPHLLLATILVFLFGKTLVEWYFDLLLI